MSCLLLKVFLYNVCSTFHVITTFCQLPNKLIYYVMLRARSLVGQRACKISCCSNAKWFCKMFGHCSSSQGDPQDFGLGAVPPYLLRRRKFWKFDYEMVDSEVYVNKYVVSIAPFSTTACPDWSQNIQKTALFCMFLLFNFSSIFPGGSQLTPFAPWAYAHGSSTSASSNMHVLACYA